MSFARGVKDELARLPLERAEDRRALLGGLVRAGWRGGEVLLEHAGAARLGYRLAKGAGVGARLILRRRGQRLRYVLRLAAPERWTRPASIRHRTASAARAYVRGVFLAAGSVTDPARSYHLELALGDPKLAAEVQHLLARRGIVLKRYVRRGQHVLYLKDGDAIADLLGFLGCTEALLAFENARARKDVRDEVNRMVNAETANVAKTVEASLRQVRAVEALRRQGRLRRLPAALQETALLREEWPEATLAELAERLGITKSGVNHRLRRLVALAEEGPVRRGGARVRRGRGGTLP
jgi:DNA-binding transcriptional regulator WhiA